MADDPAKFAVVEGGGRKDAFAGISYSSLLRFAAGTPPQVSLEDIERSLRADLREKWGREPNDDEVSEILVIMCGSYPRRSPPDTTPGGESG